MKGVLREIIITCFLLVFLLPDSVLANEEKPSATLTNSPSPSLHLPLSSLTSSISNISPFAYPPLIDGTPSFTPSPSSSPSPFPSITANSNPIITYPPLFPLPAEGEPTALRTITIHNTDRKYNKTTTLFEEVITRTSTISDLPAATGVESGVMSGEGFRGQKEMYGENKDGEDGDEDVDMDAEGQVFDEDNLQWVYTSSTPSSSTNLPSELGQARHLPLRPGSFTLRRALKYGFPPLPPPPPPPPLPPRQQNLDIYPRDNESSVIEKGVEKRKIPQAAVISGVVIGLTGFMVGLGFLAWWTGKRNEEGNTFGSGDREVERGGERKESGDVGGAAAGSGVGEDGEGKGEGRVVSESEKGGQVIGHKDKAEQGSEFEDINIEDERDGVKGWGDEVRGRFDVVLGRGGL